jgi:hypothetical protein
MASATFTRVTKRLMDGDLNFKNDTFRTILVGTPLDLNALTTLDTYQNVTNETTGVGYVAGGVDQPITVSGYLDNETYQINWSNLSGAWANATLDAAGAIIYRKDSDPNKQYLVHYLDFGGVQHFVTSNISLSFTTPTQLVIDQSGF